LNKATPNQYNLRLFFEIKVAFMQLLRGIHNSGLDTSGCVATIGNFDGVHLGHQAIIEKVIAKARQLGLPSVVILFEPQPLEFFRGADAPPRLQRFREKFECLSDFDLDYVFCVKFNAAFSQLSAQAFIDRVLLEHLHVKHLVIGDDFRFGGDRQGDFNLLVEVGQQLGFSVERTPTIRSKLDSDDCPRVSSTLVRNTLHEGDFSAAAAYLGRPFSISGRVVFGQQLGRTLGFPTANVNIRRLKAPLSGVFVVKVELEGQAVFGVANVGVKPSVGSFPANLEVHLFDFSQAIYGKRIVVEFLHKVREEQRFNGLDALTAQIKLDVAEAQRFVKSLS
jgi:riboflavin kinase / FMN adenylyltransferase